MYQDRIVCFIDILGFQEHVSRTMTRGSENSEATEALANGLRELRSALDVEDSERNDCWQVTQFSDSAVISFEVRAESEVFWMVARLLWLQISLLRHGLVVRGGVVRGLAAHDSELMFGPAVVEAYKLESGVAKFPRVIVHEDVIAAGARFGEHESDEEREFIEDSLKQDSDGTYYIDYFLGAIGELNEGIEDAPAYLGQLREIITAGLNHAEADVVAKYEWMRKEYNEAVREMNAMSCHEGDPDLSTWMRALTAI